MPISLSGTLKIDFKVCSFVGIRSRAGAVARLVGVSQIGDRLVPCVPVHRGHAGSTCGPTACRGRLARLVFFLFIVSRDWGFINGRAVFPLS